MRPSEIRELMLAEHHVLKTRLEGIRAALPSEVAPAPLSAHLKERVERFCVVLSAHMAHEESLLAPALRLSTNWSSTNLAELRKHHDDQRERLRLLMLQLRDPSATASAVVSAVSILLEEVEQDVRDENTNLLTPAMLRDDVITIDASDG